MVSAKYADWKVKLIKCVACKPRDIIEADLTQFKMLFSNLLDNAYQALNEKTGTITVSVQKCENTVWKISISDTGIGIDEDEMEKIFEPFYTTKSKGTGLGLAVCKEIAERHNGQIVVQSTKGKGATFTVTLPITQQYPLPPDNTL
jgi:signal transduction histidine kinase